MAKVALIQREQKRAKLVAKFAKKHAELKAIANDVMPPVWRCRSCPAMPTRPVSATVAN